jgi:ethanolamine ammonia-lyase small subunit
MAKSTKRSLSRSTVMSDKTKALTPTAATAGLRAYTPARVSLQRTGVSLATSEILDFQLAHAQARDAVHAHLDADRLAQRLHSDIDALAGTSILTLASAAPDRATYLRRPDLGRILSSESAPLLRPAPCDMVIVIADGLSAVAVERHAVPLLAQLIPTLVEAGWLLGPLCIATQARVAIADQIGHTLKAKLTVVLIGERPGLSSPDSLGAYITWAPQPGRTDAERNCVSNIRTEGLDYSTAAARIAFYCNEARRLRLTGTALKETSELSLPGN